MTDSTQTRRGRKPKHGEAMSDAERKRRSRAKLRREGGKELMINIKGYQWEAVQQLAGDVGAEPAEFMRLVFSNALDRLVTVLDRAHGLLERGASDKEAVEFIAANLYPAIPDINK